MASFRIYFLICVVAIAGSVDAGHIKRHHFPARTQCRSRLISNQTEPTAYGNHTHSTTSIRPSESHSPSSTKQTASSTKEANPTATSSTASSRPSTSAALDTVVTSTSGKVGATPAVTPLASSFVPNNIKAGIAGGDAYSYMRDHIGWWYDWSPNPSKAGTPIAVPMLWGNGTADQQDAQRLTAFEKISTYPPYVLGYEEPDCPSGSGSAGMSVEDGVSKWESLIAPMKSKGTKLGSPSMCKQADETWLAQFEQEISTPWDFTAIHINKNSIDGVKKDMDHYIKYNKPIWVTEFACVDDNQGFKPCTDQDVINKFIREIVDYFEGNSNVCAYAYSNGLGLGNIWPLMKDNSLSESGLTYLNAISKYH